MSIHVIFFPKLSKPHIENGLIWSRPHFSKAFTLPWVIPLHKGQSRYKANHSSTKGATVPTNSTIFKGKNLSWSLIYIVLPFWGLQLIEKRLQHKCSPLTIAKFLRTPILNNICKRCLHPYVFTSRFYRNKHKKEGKIKNMDTLL